MGNNEVLNFANSKLKKLNKCTPNETHIKELILDDNELQRLDNIDSFVKLEKLSACRNQLLRMYGVCRLHNLHTLNLSYNGILTIEGLKDLSGLKWLNLAGNSIKTIEHLNNNLNLEHLDLSENSITHIGDLSFLKNLKQLFLHKNKINHLGQCDRFLPVSLTTLTLAYNNIGDLNEISRLAHLVNLTKISICNNPCVNMTGNNIGFDYRPFVINWCLNVNVIDDYVVDAIESLRAEWLYSQGRGRHFRIGDQKELVHYLATVCPLTGETLETEDDRKLRLILSKAQHHQQQLRDQLTTSLPHSSPATKKKMQQNKNSPRLNSLRAGNRIKSPDRMVVSCYNTLSATGDSAELRNPASIMTQSLDSTMLRQSMAKSISESFSNFNKSSSEKIRETEIINSPLQAVTKMVPVPESLMSPDSKPPSLLEKLGKPQTPSGTPIKRQADAMRSPKTNRIAFGRSQINNVTRKESGTPSPNRIRKIMDSNLSRKDANKKTSILRNKSPSSEDESEINNSKLEMIQLKAEERRTQRDSDNNDKVQQAAVCIQKIWRGYYTRNKDKDIQEMFKVLQNQRANNYIQKLATDMETTKAALESERKIQMLQTEAISALWKKISSLQNVNNEDAASAHAINMTNLTQNNSEVVRELAQTCSVLQDQIQHLQTSMQDILKVMAIFSQSTNLTQHSKENGIATQTEIIAVHTPQGEAAKTFPFQKQQLHQTRPSSLPLPVSQRKKENTDSGNKELRQFAGTLVDGVIRTVSESTENQEPEIANVATGEDSEVQKALRNQNVTSDTT